MVPFFGSKITQNMSDEQNQQRLENFTGNIYNYRNKTEIPTMFQTKNVIKFMELKSIVMIYSKDILLPVKNK